MRIQNGVLITIENGRFERGFVDFEDGKIVLYGNMASAPDYAGEVYDAEGGYIMPGMIDAHTHIGISEEGLRWEGEDCNEVTDPVTAEMRAADGINPLDTAIPKARHAGVTAAGVSPGSANVIGGQIAAVKLYGRTVEDMLIKPTAAIKFATGENPKRNYGENKGKSPMTRMATASIMRTTLEKARRYMKKLEDGEDEYDPRLEALIPLLRGEIQAHFHAHRADDIMSAIRIAKEFGICCSIIHATGASNILDELAVAGVMPIVGPSMGPSSKPETNGGSFETAGQLASRGVEIAITTDHDVTPLWLLPAFAAMSVREGLPEDAALRAITINPAKALGIDERVGSIAVGKDADIAVFDGHPFNYLTRTKAVFINGKRV